MKTRYLQNGACSALFLGEPARLEVGGGELGRGALETLGGDWIIRNVERIANGINICVMQLHEELENALQGEMELVGLERSGWGEKAGRTCLISGSLALDWSFKTSTNLAFVLVT